MSPLNTNVEGLYGCACSCFYTSYWIANSSQPPPSSMATLVRTSHSKFRHDIFSRTTVYFGIHPRYSTSKHTPITNVYNMRVNFAARVVRQAASSQVSANSGNETNIHEHNNLVRRQATPHQGQKSHGSTRGRSVTGAVLLPAKVGYPRNLLSLAGLHVAEELPDIFLTHDLSGVGKLLQEVHQLGLEVVVTPDGLNLLHVP